MREVVKNIQKQLDALEKQVTALIAEKVLQEAKKLNETVEGDVAVHIFSDGANGKVCWRQPELIEEYFNTLLC